MLSWLNGATSHRKEGEGCQLGTGSFVAENWINDHPAIHNLCSVIASHWNAKSHQNTVVDDAVSNGRISYHALLCGKVSNSQWN